MRIQEPQTYEPELIEAMRLAFHKACEALQLSDSDDVFTELVAVKIIELANAGESDSEQLCSRVLSALSKKRQAS